LDKSHDDDDDHGDDDDDDDAMDGYRGAVTYELGWIKVGIYSLQ